MNITTPNLLSLFLILQLMGVWGAAPRPNVVLILTDDLGWQDVGCYDIDEPTPYETPNIDRLAGKGVRFTNGYSPAPTCAPTRCAILAGKFPARLQKTHVVGGHPPAPHSKNSIAIDPWYSGRLKVEEYTIANALADQGYHTGAVGKWHCAINHHAYPGAKDQGFQYATMDIGATRKMSPDRLSDFATDSPDDPYRLDANGFPYHQNTEDALTFLRQNEDPFFLYYATWLVHTPIHTRNEALLRKYCHKMGVEFPTEAEGWDVEGQYNPYYGAMVETLDYHVGRIISYLEETEDPRNQGHKLIDNTYIIFTSDNGGMEKHPGEVITDNYPLDKGKINAKEGGIRVPYLVSGPGIPAGKVSDEIVSGLDFYPTIMEWTGASTSQELDGISLKQYLEQPADRALDRDTLYWHFPHSVFQSCIRERGDKLIYNPIKDYLGQPALELYRLYDTQGQRQDIEEAQDLSSVEPERAEELYGKLKNHLDEVKASMPFLNPACASALPHKEHICTPTGQSIILTSDDLLQVKAQYKENGARVTAGYVYYTNNGGDRYEEWYPVPAQLSDGEITAILPRDATHYCFSLVDEHHFLVSYPELPEVSKSKGQYAKVAFAVPSAPKQEAVKHTAQQKYDERWLYPSVGDTELYMDAFLPAGYGESDQTYPAFVVFHGGSWQVGDTGMHYPDCEYWASRGMVAVSVDYRLGKRDGIKNVPYDCMVDACAAMRYIRDNASQLKINPDQVVVAGGSAGGQLAASLAMIELPSQSQTSVIPDALVLYNPYFKCKAEYSPPMFVKEGIPPMITFLGGRDPAIAVEDLLSFHTELKEHGNVSRYYVGHEGKHGFMNGRNPWNPFFYWGLELTDAFLVEQGILSGEAVVQRPDGVKSLRADEFTDYQ